MRGLGLGTRESGFLKKKKSTPDSFVITKNAVRPADEQRTEFHLTLRNVGQPKAVMTPVALGTSR